MPVKQLFIVERYSKKAKTWREWDSCTTRKDAEEARKNIEETSEDRVRILVYKMTKIIN